MLHEINILYLLSQKWQCRKKYQSINKTNKKFQIRVQPYTGPSNVNTFPLFVFLFPYFTCNGSPGIFWLLKDCRVQKAIQISSSKTGFSEQT